MKLKIVAIVIIGLLIGVGSAFGYLKKIVEPATMLLTGIGLTGLAAFGRYKFSNKKRRQDKF